MKIDVYIISALLCTPLFIASSAHERTPLVKKAATQQKTALTKEDIIQKVTHGAFVLSMGEYWEYVTSGLDRKTQYILHAFWQRGKDNPCAKEKLLNLQAKAIVNNWEQVYIDAINDLIPKAEKCSRCS